jgi:hypothetical protein
VLHVSPGYAVDCSGEDIVACEPLSCTLGKDCAAKPTENVITAFSKLVEENDVLGRSPALKASKEYISYWDKYREHIFASDLYIVPHSRGILPGLAARCEIKKPASKCDYTRYEERGKLELRPPSVPPSEPYDCGMKEFNDCRAVICKFQQFLQGAPQGDRIRKWFQDWINSKQRDDQTDHPPLLRFPFVRQWLSICEDEELKEVANQIKLLFWLVQDWRHQLLTDKCPTWSRKGVPLARIWLFQHCPDSYLLLAIERDPPYRRPLGRDRKPAPWGKVNLDTVFLKGRAEAKRRLSELGVEAEFDSFTMPPTIDELRDNLHVDSLCTPSGSSVTLLTEEITDLVVAKAPASDSTPNVDDEPVSRLSGVGPPTEKLLVKAGYPKIGDLRAIVDDESKIEEFVKKVKKVAAELGKRAPNAAQFETIIKSARDLRLDRT